MSTHDPRKVIVLCAILGDYSMEAVHVTDSDANGVNDLVTFAQRRLQLIDDSIDARAASQAVAVLADVIHNDPDDGEAGLEAAEEALSMTLQNALVHVTTWVDASID